MSRTYIDSSKILNKIRSLNENAVITKQLLREEGGEQMPEKAIAITDDPKFGEKVLSKQKEHFRSAVDNGVEFARPDNGNPEESPLIYMPETGNIIFSGTIPSLGNLKWQFVLKNNTGNGCFIWADELILNKDNLNSANELEQLKNLN